MSKEDSRKIWLKQRASMGQGEVAFKTNAIFKQFCAHLEEIGSVNKLALYYPIQGEVDTRPFFEFYKKRKTKFFFPKILSSAEMAFFSADDFSELQIGSFGIAEPGPLAMREDLPDLVLVPGLLFSSNGHRIGYGKGYYDRWIGALGAQRRVVKCVGLCYDFQLQDGFELNPYDQKMDLIVTESKTLITKV